MFDNNSESVEDDRYLLAVMRYIHNNPLKAQMAESQAEYVWSSYQKYLDAYKNIFCWVDTEMIRSYFNSCDDFEKFSCEENQDDCLDTRTFIKCTDEDIKELIKASKLYSRIMDLPKAERNECIQLIYRETGGSIRQLSRVLSIGKRIIENAIKEH